MRIDFCAIVEADCPIPRDQLSVHLLLAVTSQSQRPVIWSSQNDKPQGLPLRESSWRRMFCRDLFTGFIRTKAASEKRVPNVVNNRVGSRLNHRHIFVSDPPNLKTVQSLDTFTKPLSSHWTIFRLITEHQIHDPRLPIIDPHVFCSVILCCRVQSLSPFAGWICMAVCLRDAFTRTIRLSATASVCTRATCSASSLPLI